jgi:hypothetical protein
MTDRYALIKNPLDISKSYFIHMDFALLNGQDIESTKVLDLLGPFNATVNALSQEAGLSLKLTPP